MGDSILGTQVSEESESRRLLEEGMIESYVDFVYLTKGDIPVAVMPADYAAEDKGGYKVGSEEKISAE